MVSVSYQWMCSWSHFFSIIKMSALSGQCTKPFGCNEFTCHPMTGVRTVRELLLFQDKREEEETELSPSLDPLESWPRCSPPTNGHLCRSITSGPAHLTSKEKSQKQRHHKHKPHTASNDQDVGLSVALSKYRQGDWFLTAERHHLWRVPWDTSHPKKVFQSPTVPLRLMIFCLICLQVKTNSKF